MKLCKLVKTTHLFKMFGIVSIVSILLGTGLFFVFSAKQSTNKTYYEPAQLSQPTPGKTTKLTTTPQKEPTLVTPDTQPTTATATNTQKQTVTSTQKQTATNTRPSGYNPNYIFPPVTITASNITYEVIPDPICNIQIRSTLTSNQSGGWSVLFHISPDGGSPDISPHSPSFTAGQPAVVEINWYAVASPNTSRVNVGITVSPYSGTQQQVNFTPPAPVTIDC